MPVVTVSWWNAPLAADKGNPWGNSGDALKEPMDTDYSGTGGSFGPQGPLTVQDIVNKLMAPPAAERPPNWFEALAGALGGPVGGHMAQEFAGSLVDTWRMLVRHQAGNDEQTLDLSISAMKQNPAGRLAIGFVSYGLLYQRYQDKVAEGDRPVRTVR